GCLPSEAAATLYSMLTTNQKGTVAETAVIHAAVKLGLGVWIPISGHERYDLILDAGPNLVRVQCKTAVLFGDVLLIRMYSTRRCAAGLLKRVYSTADADAFAPYSPELNRCYFLEMAEFAGQSQVSLRLEPTRNNQLAGVRWARDFEFEAKLGAHLGPIAQLGERRHGMPKAAGSSPA